MRKTNVLPKTLQEAVQHFLKPEVCRAFVAEIRWPDGPCCPGCGSKNVRFLAMRGLWECKTRHAKRQFSVKVGTIFEDSPISLSKWLTAVWIIANAKNGVSSYEIARSIGVTQKTGWFMLHRIRLAMQSGTFVKLSGEVEVDETFIAGRARFMHKDRRDATIKGRGGIGSGKAAVVGLLERHGPDKTSRVKTKVVPSTRKGTLHSEVREHVQAGSELYTDSLKSYEGLEGEYVHQVINHAECYAIGRVHRNGMENFWSLLKQSIKGTYVNVEPFHLFRYLDEQTFRFNERKDNDCGRFLKVLSAVIGRRLTFEKLVECPA